MNEQAVAPHTKRAPYSRPVLEDLGSMRELTAAGGPTFGADSSYTPGGAFGLS